MKDLGLYIHIPFCAKKCDYCDFKSFENKGNLIDEYIKWLNYEIKSIGESNKNDFTSNLDSLINLKTIYIGGGTPSFINSNYIKMLLETIKNNFQMDKNVEITIEVNPGTITREKLKDYKEAGINRLSIGSQSTIDRILKEIGRIHKYSDIINTYNLARSMNFNNINLDLMIGLPKQTIDDVISSINDILKMNPEHISVYSLILEEGTKFYEKWEKNELILPNDEEERSMYWTVKKMLEKAGYIHYEISNFSKPGFESKHNLDCWKQEEYIGVGVAAHSYTNNIRYSNINNIEQYIQNYKNGSELDNLVFHEKQNMQNKMKEYMILGLRKIEGIHIQEFKRKFGNNPIMLFKKELDKLVKEDLIEIDGDIIKLTFKGLDLANLVWEEFI